MLLIAAPIRFAVCYFISRTLPVLAREHRTSQQSDTQVASLDVALLLPRYRHPEMRLLLIVLRTDFPYRLQATVRCACLID